MQTISVSIEGRGLDLADLPRRRGYGPAEVAELATANGFECIAVELGAPGERVVLGGVRGDRGWFRFEWRDGAGMDGYRRVLGPAYRAVPELRDKKPAGLGIVRYEATSGPIGIKELKTWLGL